MLGINVNQPAGFTTDTCVRLGAVVHPEVGPGASAVLLSCEIEDPSDDKARDTPLGRHDCSGHASKRVMK